MTPDQILAKREYDRVAWEKRQMSKKRKEADAKAEIANREQEIESKISMLNNLASPSFTSPLSCLSAQSPEKFMDFAHQGKSIAPRCLEGNIDVYAIHAPLSDDENNELKASEVLAKNESASRPVRECRAQKELEDKFQAHCAPNRLIPITAEPECLFCLGLLKHTSSPADPSLPFQSKQLTDPQNPSQRLSSKYFDGMLQHCLFFEAQFNKVGKLDVEGTFLEKMEVRGINTNLYSLASMTNTFSGVCFFPNLGDGWIAPRQKADLADRAWLMSSDWFLNNPELGRKASLTEVSEQETVNKYDRRSKTLVVVDKHKLMHEMFVNHIQYGFVKRNTSFETEKKAARLQFRKLGNQSIPLLNERLQPLVESVRQLFGYSGAEQYHTLNFMHIGLPLHFDRAGPASAGLFSGPGHSICTLRLDGPDVYIFVQEHPSIALAIGRFPV